jgi:Tfp pilus assembly protein PilF
VDRIARLQAFLKENPADSFLRHALALEYVKLGNDGDAEKLFREILDHEPGYIGSYYHLAKLLERIGQGDDAMQVYEKGMAEAKKAGDNHSYNELLSAKDELE